MKKSLFVLVLTLFLATQIHAQQTSSTFTEFDGRIMILHERLGQDLPEPAPSFRVEPNVYYVLVYAGPPAWAPLYPNGNTMQTTSVSSSTLQTIGLGPTLSSYSLYMVVIYDFEDDGIIEAGEWKDINGNFIAETNEWFDDGDGIRQYGEWTDTNGNGLVDLNELYDGNGNGVFDIGEWHEGKNVNVNPSNDLPGEFNGAVDPTEWIGMNLDRSITKKVALKMYKRISNYYKEIDYKEYFNTSAKISQHPALKAMTTLSDNQKIVLTLELDECERCEVVGDVAWYEDEYARIVINFKGFSRETLQTPLPRCEGCYEAEITHYVNLQIALHERYTLIYENFYLHTLEPKGLPDNTDGTTAYYYTPGHESSATYRQLVSFDPYYLIVRSDTELVLFETDYGKALIVPYKEKEEEYASHIYTRKYSDGTEKNIRVEVIHVYQIETPDCEQAIVARLLVDSDTSLYNTSTIDPDEKVYTIFYYACDNTFENNVIFPEEYQEGLSDFAIIVEKVELENEKVWLKFVREVDTETILSPAVFPYGMRDYQIVFDNLDRSKPLGACDFYPKEERYVPQFQKILVDVCLPIRDLLNSVVLKYEDLKGEPTAVSSYEEQPWEISEWNTEVTQVQIRKVTYNPNAADYTALGYEGNPPFSAYVPPLDPAPGLVQIGANLVPNFQISDEDFSGTCVPGDTITFYLEVFNGGAAPIPVLVEDDIPLLMTNAAVAAPGTIQDTNGNGIVGDGGDTVSWNLAALPPGYTLLSYQATVATTSPPTSFGGTVVNGNARVTYYDAGIPRVSTAPAVIILVQAAQLIKEPFQDLACTIPAPVIAAGQRLYYRLTVYNTISPASPVPYTPTITEITDVIPGNTTNPMYEVSPPLMVPQPIVANTVSWQGASALGPGNSIAAVYSVLVPVGSAGRITNNAELTYLVVFPPPTTTTVITTSNSVDTWIQFPLTQQLEPLEPCLTMSIEKEGPVTQASGNVRYHISVTNLGDGSYADAFNIVIIDKIPLNLGPPFNIICTNPLVTWNTYDSDGDGTIETIVWKLDQLAAGDGFDIYFSTAMRDIPYNCYLLKVYTQDLYRQDADRYLGMGGVARVGEYRFTPEDLTEVVKDAVFVQVMKGSQEVENFLMKIFESRIYDKEVYFQFADFSEKERSVRFRLFHRVQPTLDLNIYWGVLEELTMSTGSPQILSGDAFLAHALLRNEGNGMATQISYEIDAPEFSPQDMTWVYNLQEHLLLEISPGEQADLLFLMKAPLVSHETTFPIKVKVTYSDGVEIRTVTKTIYLNVLSERRASLEVKKTIVEGKSVVKETGKEVADLRVGEERTIVVYIKNVAEEEIKQLHYVDQIPQGLEVVEGKAEWMGTLKPGETVKVTYKIRVKQIGIYQFKGKTFYKDERGHVYESVSNTTEIRVITEPGPKLKRELDSSTVARGDVLTVVVRVENDTPNTLKKIQVVDIIPEGFTVLSLETKDLQDDNGTIRYYINELKPSKYVLLKYTLKAGEKAGKYTYLGVRVAYENGNGVKEEVVTEDDSLLIPETETPNIQPSYTLVRKVDADGEYITAVLNLENMGGISATKVKIRATLPEGTQFIEASADNLQEPGTIIFNVDEISAGDLYAVKYTFKVPHFNQDRTYAYSVEIVYSDNFDRNYASKAQDKFIVRYRTPDVRVSKVVERDAVKLNFSVRVAVTAQNNGDVAAVTRVVDPLPEGMVLISGTNEWEGTLEPGESSQILYEMLCTRVGNFELPLAAATYEDEWKTAYVAESAPNALLVQGILVEKSADVASLKVGEVVVVTVVVTNTYEEKATNIDIRDTDNVPKEFLMVEGDTSWVIPLLNPGERAIFTYSLKPTVSGSFSLGPAAASFIDVYNDKHESLSGSVSVAVEEMVAPEEKKEVPVEEAKKVVETITKRLSKSFDVTLILVIFLIMAISMVLAFILIEQRRTEEEVPREIGLPVAPVGREAIYKPVEIRKPSLPTPRKRAEVTEEATPLEVVGRRREKIEERKEEVEKVAKAVDIREILKKEEGMEVKEEEEFEFGEELITRKREDLGLEDLFGKEELAEKEDRSAAKFTDVRDILKKPRNENTMRSSLWGRTEEDRGEKPEIPEVPDLKDLIKGKRKTEEEESEKKEEEDTSSDLRGILKGKD